MKFKQLGTRIIRQRDYSEVLPEPFQGLITS